MERSAQRIRLCKEWRLPAEFCDLCGAATNLESCGEIRFCADCEWSDVRPEEDIDYVTKH